MIDKFKNFFTLKKGDGIKSKDTTASIWKVPHRKAAVKVAKLLVNTGVTPNQITLVSFLLKIPSAYLFSLGEYKYIFVGALLFYLSWFLDFLDGCLARLRKTVNNRGAWFDFGSDEFGNVIVLFGVCLGLYSRMHTIWVWIFGFLAVASIQTVTLVYQVFIRYFPKGDAKVIEQQKKKTKILKQFFYNDPFFNTTLIVAGLTNLLYPFIIMCAVYGWLFTIVMFLALTVKSRNL